MIEKPSFRVLVADDFEPWRRYVRSKIQGRMGWLIVGEASDGAAAIEKAQELRPDLIMLDIGLPKVNGIEAARQIRQLAPSCKILFTSESRSWDIAEEALQTGAFGYVVKRDAARELLLAAEAVLQGNQFISASLAGYHLRDELKESTRLKTVLKSPVAALEAVRRHEIELYSDERWLLDHLTRFVGSTLHAGNVAIVIATESHRGELILRLEALGLDIKAAIEQGRYMVLDAADTLSMFMVNDMPDPIRFTEGFGNLIQTVSRDARGNQRRVVVFGEGTQILLEKGNGQAAIEIEKLCNRLTRSYDVDILCGCRLPEIRDETDNQTIQQICAEHSAVYSH